MQTSFLNKTQKVLLVDDDRTILELYQEVLSKVGAKPEIHIADSGRAAIERLSTDQFSLLLSDLRMTELDGFQLLAIVRRRFPHLRTVVMTGLDDSHFRSRAYSLGVDLFVRKPASPQEWEFFTDSIDWLLHSEAAGGFRGMQTKSLVDIIQLECLSRYSSTLRVSTGEQTGHIWFDSGEVVDAQQGHFSGEDAFRRILSWRGGGFEILPPDRKRARTIFTSYQTLLLETVQVLDEATEHQHGLAESLDKKAEQYGGIRFIVTANGPEQIEGWGVENAKEVASWTRRTLERFTKIGIDLQLGPAARIDAVSGTNQVVLVSRGLKDACVGYDRKMSQTEAQSAIEQLMMAHA